MVEIKDIRIYTEVPPIYGQIESCMGDARFVDENKGKVKTKDGFLVWKWDKAVTVLGNTIEEVANKLSESITEVLCKKR